MANKLVLYDYLSFSSASIFIIFFQKKYVNISFFKCISPMQELNTAEDFISCYEEIIPLVQTLPLVILHKESIFSNLLSRVQIKARLSLEPILRYAPLIC